MSDQKRNENRPPLAREEPLQRLTAYADLLSKADGDYSNIFDSPGEGLEIIFDAILVWTFNVKVRRPWKIFGEETSEVFEVFQRSIRSHIATSQLASSLIDSKPDQFIDIEEELRYYNPDIWAPEDVGWPRSIYDWEECDGDWPVFLQTESSSENLKRIVAADEKAVLISRYISGFEGRESELASIRRRHEMFLDGASGEEPAWLRDVVLVNEPVLLFDGVVLSDEDRRWLLQAASELLPSV